MKLQNICIQSVVQTFTDYSAVSKQAQVGTVLYIAVFAYTLIGM